MADRRGRGGGERQPEARPRAQGEEVFGEDLPAAASPFWGLAFKPQTDDVREAPALTIARELVKAGARVVGTDPEGRRNFAAAVGVEIEYADDPYEAAKGADAVVLCTEWNEYRQPDLQLLKSLMHRPVILDGRNILDPVRIARAGFEYRGIGRGNGPIRVSSVHAPSKMHG